MSYRSPIINSASLDDGSVNKCSDSTAPFQISKSNTRSDGTCIIYLKSTPSHVLAFEEMEFTSGSRIATALVETIRNCVDATSGVVFATMAEEDSGRTLINAVEMAATINRDTLE
ncbi:hypothetical protein MTP99_001651 [Tenebrio molitor]|nr:hypothetical protein MTP99_001651 [Tenebrio molitor]